MNLIKLYTAVYVKKKEKIKQQQQPLVRPIFECPFESCAFPDGSVKYFPTKHQLNQHLLKVHAKKQFSCGKCGKKFGYDKYRMHHEESCGQTWSCPCGQTYTIREALLTHCRRHQHQVPPHFLRRKKTNDILTKPPPQPPPPPPSQPFKTQRHRHFRSSQHQALTNGSSSTPSMVPVVLVLQVNRKSAATSENKSTATVEKATVATQTSAPSQKSAEVQTVQEGKQRRSRPAAKTQTLPNHLTPAETQTFPNLTPAETQTFPNLTPAETQTWPNLTPAESQTWPNLTPAETQTWPSLMPEETQTWPNLTPAETQTWPNLTPAETQTCWKSLLQSEDPWLASIHTQTPGPLPAQTQTAWEEDVAALLAGDKPLPLLDEDIITLMDTETQTAPELSHSSCQTLEELFPNI